MGRVAAQEGGQRRAFVVNAAQRLALPRRPAGPLTPGTVPEPALRHGTSQARAAQ